MLPDFPKEKALLQKFWNQYLAHKHKELLGIFATIPSFAIHEGDRWKLERSDGTESEQNYQEMSSGFTISLEEVPDLTPEKIKAKLDAAAEDGAQQMTQSIYKEIEEATRAVGNAVDGKGKPFSKELFLEMLEKIDMDFTPDGQLIPPTFVMPPNAVDANKTKFKEWDQDEEFNARHTELINKKREKWYAREALRKLVD
jgi:hypothetical protein